MNREKRPFELYVFDWDGTLMDTTRFIALSIQQAARSLGYPEPSFAVAESVIGLGHEDMMRRAVPECPASDYERFAAEYWKAYIGQEAGLPGLHPGIEALLSNMKRSGLWLAVATGKSRGGLNRVFRKTGAGPLFVAMKTADETASKPAPDMLIELSEELCVPAPRMVMVGDAVHDLEMARAAGVPAIGVTWGAARRESLEALSPRAVVDDVPQLARAMGVEDLLPAA